MAGSIHRFVPYSLRTDVTRPGYAEAHCAASCCDGTSGPRANSAEVETWCLTHSGGTGHFEYTWRITSRAVVTRKKEG